MSSLHSDLFIAGFHQACGRGDPATENLPATGLRQAVSSQGGLQGAVTLVLSLMTSLQSKGEVLSMKTMI